MNPDLSLLSVRGMMVHSARWTEEMKRIGSINDIMSICGYGIPDEKLLYLAMKDMLHTSLKMN